AVGESAQVGLIPCERTVKAWLQSALVVCVALCGTALPADVEPRAAAVAQNPYQQQFNEIAQQVFAAGIAASEQAVLLRQAYELRDYLADRGALTRLLERA